MAWEAIQCNLGGVRVDGNSTFVRKARNIFLAGCLKKMAAVFNCLESWIVKSSLNGQGLVHRRLSKVQD